MASWRAYSRAFLAAAAAEEAEAFDSLLEARFLLRGCGKV